MQNGKNKKTGDSVDKIYKILKKKIVTNEIQAGQYLRESELMREHKIGRTPLRQALLLLRNDNFVEWQPHRSPFVKELSLDEIKEIFETLVIVEKNINYLAALRANDEDNNKIAFYCGQVEKAITEKKFWDITEKNLLFHEEIATAARNRFLKKIYISHRMQAERLSYLAVSRKTNSYTPEEHNKKIIDQHRRLAECIKNRDITVVEELSVSHVKLFQERILNDILDYSFL